MTQNDGSLPADLAHPGGIIEETRDWILSTAPCPQPLFALAGALALGSVLYGRHVRDEGGQRTNIYLMMVGATSSGKNAPLRAVARAIDSCNAPLRMGQVTSDSALEYALKRGPRTCLLLDEGGAFFESIKDARKTGSPLGSLRPALLELWSSAGSRWLGKQRCPKEKETPPVAIDNPSVTLLSASQPELLFGALGKQDLHDGWLGRNLVFISGARPKPVFVPEQDVPNRIKAEVLLFKNEPTGVTTISSDAEAQRAFANLGDEAYRAMCRTDEAGDGLGAIWGKAVENARRIALILAVGRDGLKATVTGHDAAYATGLVRFLVGGLIRAVKEQVSENDSERTKKRLLQIVASCDGKGITKSDLTRRSQFCRRAFRDECISDLVEAGQLVRKIAGNGGEVFFVGS